MKRRINILAAVVILAISGTLWAESASVLFEKGLYAEETEGNLEKAIEIYQQVIDQAGKIRRLGAQATYQLGMCYLKKGEQAKAAKYFQQVVSDYPTEKVIVENANKQLERITPEQFQTNLYAQLPPEVIIFIGNKYGAISSEAGLKNLYSNSHIYYVTTDFVLMRGGMAYYHNMSAQPLTSKVRLSGTSYPNQTLFDIAGRKMNTEIVPDKARPNFYHIYWTPDEPIAPRQFFYYGWSIDSSKKLRTIPVMPNLQRHTLTMQNKFGNRVVETFFFVVPNNIRILTQGENYTAKETISDFDIYYWTKEVPPDTNHSVEVVLVAKESLSEEAKFLIKELHNPEAPRFVALNKLIEIGPPAVEPLIVELQKSNNWQVPKALGAIQDKRAIGPLIEKWQKADWSPMKEVISEALVRITGKQLGQDQKQWQQWWDENGQFLTPEDTIRNFMSAAMMLDAQKAMSFVAPESHDYQDIKRIFEMPDHPFNIVFRKLDPSAPTKILEAKVIDSMCIAVWQMTFKEEFTVKGKTFKAGETFELDGNLHKYGDKWLITGI